MTLLSWSGGKDGALALGRLEGEVDGLLTTVTRPFDRITMHGVRESLLVEQVRRLGLDLHVVDLPEDASNGRYEAAMETALRELAPGGERRRIAFGDIFLEDVRRFREEMLEPTGFEAVFPLWGRDTTELAEELLDAAMRAVVVCVDTERLSPAFLGRSLDRSFFDGLPAGVDPCGENGEYHTFVFDGPAFSEPVPFEVGRIEERGRFHYLDLTERAS